MKDPVLRLAQQCLVFVEEQFVFGQVEQLGEVQFQRKFVKFFTFI